MKVKYDVFRNYVSVVNVDLNLGFYFVAVSK